MDLLPVELTKTIVLGFSEKDVYECMKVCKAWYSRLSPFYYYNVRIISFHKRFLEQTETTRIDGRRIGDFVRSIEFASPYPPIYELLDKHDFCRLIENLPYLQTIQFRDGIDCYVKFMESVQIDKLKHVQEVTVQGISKDIRGTHVSINVILKDRITKLYLDDMDVILSRHDEGQYNDFFTTLSTFKKLKHLEVFNNKRLHTPEYLVSFFNACNDLTCFQFKSTCDHRLPRLLNNRIHTNLKSLNLAMKQGIKPDHLDYIMEYLPNLNELKLSSFKLRKPDDSLLTLDSERGKSFLQYLKRLTRFEIKGYKDHARSSRIWQGSDVHSDSYSVQGESFWTYIHTLIGEGYSCDLTIHITHLHEEGPLVISADKEKKTVSIENIWMKTYSTREDWINSMQFLTLRRVTIQGSHYDWLHPFGYDNMPHILPPLIRLMKANKTGHIHIKNTIDHRKILVRLKFFKTYLFDQRLKAQLPEEVPVQQGQKRKRSSASIRQDEIIRNELIKSMKQLTKNERLLRISHSIHDIEYLVECK